MDLSHDVIPKIFNNNFNYSYYNVKRALYHLLSGLLAIPQKSIAIAIPILDQKSIAIAIPILFLETIAIPILS